MFFNLLDKFKIVHFVGQRRHLATPHHPAAACTIQSLYHVENNMAAVLSRAFYSP